MAVGIIIGAAFGKIVDSLVKDILMPPISFFLGKLDFSNLFFVLKDGANLKGSYVSLQQAMDDGAITLNLGNFLNASISFFIVAFAVFVLVKAINEIREKIDKQEAKAMKTKICPYCCSEIDAKAVKCPYCTSDLSS